MPWGETVANAEVGDNCYGWDETTSRSYPACEQGLACALQDGMFTPGTEYACIEPDGHYYTEEDVDTSMIIIRTTISYLVLSLAH